MRTVFGGGGGVVFAVAVHSAQCVRSELIPLAVGCWRNIRAVDFRSVRGEWRKHRKKTQKWTAAAQWIAHCIAGHGRRNWSAFGTRASCRAAGQTNAGTRAHNLPFTGFGCSVAARNLSLICVRAPAFVSNISQAHTHVICDRAMLPGNVPVVVCVCVCDSDSPSYVRAHTK